MTLRFSLPLVTLCLSLPSIAQTGDRQPATAAPATPTCTIDRSMPSDADKLLASKQYPEAEASYRDALAQTPTSGTAQLGIVRALIGQDKTTEAQAYAADMLKQNAKSAVAEIATAEATIRTAAYPQSPLAQVAAGDAAYRAADFDAARQFALTAFRLDPCNAQALALLSNLESLFAYFASAASHIATAHKLRPGDEIIRRDWIDSLPRKERAAELEKYLAETTHLSDKDHTGYSNESQYLKARRPGDCRITSKANTVSIPFLPVFEDSSRPRAYGLDLSLNGTRRRMQIDTGASGIILTASAAKSLHLTPEYRIHTGGVGDEGEVESYLAHVATIQVGGVQLANCMVEVLAKSSLNVDGLIGINVFSRWLVTLDYPNAKLLLNPLPPRPSTKDTPTPPTPSTTDEQADAEENVPHDAYVAPQMTDWMHIARVSHNILLPAILNKGQVHYIIADTGASQSTLSVPFASSAGKLHENSNVTFTGISGKVKKVYDLDYATLQFGHLLLPPANYFAFDLSSISHDTGVEVSGFIGLPTLSRLTMTIDYRDNLLQLKYDPKHDSHMF